MSHTKREGSHENTLHETSKVEDVIELSDDSVPEVEDATQMDVDVQNETLNDSVLEKGVPKPAKLLEDKLNITPKKVLSPKQVQKKLESEKKREERRLEKEEKDKQKNEERERQKQERLKQKLERDEQKKKEKEMKEAEKQKKKEEKDEMKKKELEEKEQKKKEKEEKLLLLEQEKIKKKEVKHKEVEKIQKTSAAFVNFFVAKKTDGISETKRTEEIDGVSMFKPFEVKSDMRMPLERRDALTESEKESLVQVLKQQDQSKSYLKDLKDGKPVGKCSKTWPFEEDTDDVEVVEEESGFGESICEQDHKKSTMRTKFLKFNENRRPAYHGTWRKKTKHISGRKPFGRDKDLFNYEEESDDDWEEEEQGESIHGSDDEKENEPEDDYEVDNEFFVPHGHLSEDEMDDEENNKLSPEHMKEKLKLLKDEFDQDMQSKTHRLKSRSIGCIWYNKDGSCDEEAIDKYLRPLAMITNGSIIIKDRNEIFAQMSNKKKQATRELEPNAIVTFLKVIHGNRNKKRILVEQFLTEIGNQNGNVDLGKAALFKQVGLMATWKKCTEDGPLRNKSCWLVNDEIQKKYKVELSLDKCENI